MFMLATSWKRAGKTPSSHSSHGDLAVLKRLAQRLEHGSLELRQLVEKSTPRCASVASTGLGPGHPPTTAPLRRCGGVTETGACRSAAARQGRKTDDGVDACDLGRLVLVTRAARPAGGAQHRLADARQSASRRL